MIQINKIGFWACLLCIQSFGFVVFAQETNSATNAPAEPHFIEDFSLPTKKSFGKMVVTETKPDAHIINRYDEPILVKQEPETPEEIKEEAATKTYTLQGIGSTIASNVALYNFIDEWYGVKYRMGGHDKTGIDCSAFVQKLYEAVFGTSLLRSSVEQFKSCDKLKDCSNMKEGDLVFFQRTYGRRKRKRTRIAHVGIYLANNYFVHASSSQGVTISSLEEPYWKRIFAGAGKVNQD